MELDSKDGLYHTSSQTEISDEEIEKKSDVRFGGGEVNYNLRYGFKEGAKWAIDKLKNKK